jgi:hypothetical protein
MWRGGLGGAYRLPTLSSVGVSLVPPCFRFHIPLIAPDVRISRIRRSEKGHEVAHGKLRVRLVRQTRPSTLWRDPFGNRLVPGQSTLCLAHNH